MVEITLDGKKCLVEPSHTLLDIAKKQGVDIPCLCGVDGLNGDCGLCVVEVSGKGYQKARDVIASKDMNVVTESASLSKLRKRRLEDILSAPNVSCSVPPCQIACPAKVDIQVYLAYIAQNDHRKAIEVIKKTLPMPLSIGRVCPAFCEADCHRAKVDEPLAIRHLKRHAADLDLASFEAYTPESKPAKNKKVAIVGAGPGGLSCGYFLSNEGYQVTVYEAMSKAGGWLIYGIPEYRLPKSILDKEIEVMCANGMKVKTNQKLGVNFELSELTEDYDAVCLAVGASLASEMQYTGSELKGCYLGVDFLKDQATENQYSVGKKVAVIGGGNTAIDCARTALRKGADTTLIYRRTRSEMPAEDYEIEEAEHEGVKFHFLTNPVENIADDLGRVQQVKLERMALGEPDSSGRRRPQATGEYFTEDFDTVIAAVSQKTDLSFIQDSCLPLDISRWDTINVEEETMHTGAKNIFAIGDVRRGPATAIEAIADGRVAAKGIDTYLGGDMEKLYVDSFRARNLERTHLINSDHVNRLTNAIRSMTPGKGKEQIEANLNQLLKKFMRVKVSELSIDQRQLSFDEVEKGFSNQAAIDEAKRCLSCGCNEGNDCKLRRYSTDYKVDKQAIVSGHSHKVAMS